MTENAARPVRWGWLIFAVLLAAGLMSFSLSVNWSDQTWLDLTALIVSVISVTGVFLFASQRQPVGAAFWRMFRWLFIGVVTWQAVLHALEVAHRRGFTSVGAIAFIAVVAVILSWIYAAQWIAMTRLARQT